MSWHDPGGLWVRKVRSRVRWLALATLALALVTALAGFLTVEIFIKWSRGTWHPWRPDCTVAFPLLVLAATAVAWRATFRHAHALRLVARAEGWLCPACHAYLGGLGESGKCPTCAAPFDERRLRRYWENFAFARQGQEIWGSRRRDRALRWVRARPYVLFPVVLALFLGYGAWEASLSGRGALYGMLTTAPLGLIWAFNAMGMVVGFRTAVRAGDSVHCARCDYQHPPAGDASELCSECGLAWREPGNSVHGEKVKPAARLKAGLPYMLALIPVAAIAIAALHNVERFVPLSMLLPGIHAGPGPVQLDAFDELSRRSLTREEARAVADALIAERKNRGFLQPQMDAWLLKRAIDGTLPREYLGRLLGSSARLEHFASIEKDGSRSVIVDFSLNPGAGALPATTAPAQFVIFGGFCVGDNDAPQSRSIRAFPVRTTSTHPLATPSMTLSGQPGDAAVRVRAVVWNILLPPGGTLDAITWLDDGTPRIPSDALWSERVELETEVEFQPRKPRRCMRRARVSNDRVPPLASPLGTQPACE